MLTTVARTSTPSTRLHRGRCPLGRVVHTGYLLAICTCGASIPGVIGILLRLPPGLEGQQPGLGVQDLIHREPDGERQATRRRALGHQAGPGRGLQRGQLGGGEGRPPPPEPPPPPPRGPPPPGAPLPRPT